MAAPVSWSVERTRESVRSPAFRRSSLLPFVSRPPEGGTTNGLSPNSRIGSVANTIHGHGGLIDESEFSASAYTLDNSIW